MYILYNTSDATRQAPNFKQDANGSPQLSGIVFYLVLTIISRYANQYIHAREIPIPRQYVPRILYVGAFFSLFDK